MKVKNSITTAIISATVGLLNPFVPELTPTRLIAALQEYDDNKKSSENERPKQPYTVNEFCELFRISKPTLYRMQIRGELSILKIGSSTRVSADEVERLLSSKQEHNQS